MSDVGIGQDCLIHYDNQHIQVRRDFFGLCSYDKSQFNQKRNSKGNVIKDEPNQECMAKIVRLVETLINHQKAEWAIKAHEAKAKGFKIPPMPKEFYVELAYSAICSLLYNTYGESTVRNSVAHLITLGYLKRSQYAINSIPKYTLNLPFLQEALQKQAQTNFENGLLNSTPYFKKRGRPRKEKVGVEFNTQDTSVNTQLSSSNSQDTSVNSQASEFNTNNIESKKTDKETNTERDSESGATPSTSSQPKDASLSPEILNLFHAFNEERTRCFQEINETFEIIAIPKLNSTEYKKFAVWAATGVTEQDIRDRFHRFWDLRDKDGTHWWQKDKRLTLKAFCARDDVGNTPANPLIPIQSQGTPQTGLTQEQCQSIDQEVRELSERYQIILVPEIIEEKGVWVVEILDNKVWCRMADWGGWTFFRDTLIKEEDKYLAEQHPEQQRKA